MNINLDNYEKYKLPPKLEENLRNIKFIMGNTSDLLSNEIEVCGHKAAFLCCEGLVSTATVTQLIFHPLMNLTLPENSQPGDIFKAINSNLIIAIEKKSITEYGDLIRALMSGFVAIFADGVAEAIIIGVQGYEKRGIDEPPGEVNLKGPREGFVETIRTNISLIRRKMKTPTLRFELTTLGSRSKTDICYAYLCDKVPVKMLNSIKKKISNIQLETILSSGYIEPFLEGKKSGIFQNIGTTERPDVACSKLLEGKVLLIVDGTPFVIIIPYLFIENFQTVDDYTVKPYYAAFIRWIKYFAFFISLLLPGVYVAIAYFHPDLINSTLLLNLAESEKGVPFPLALEAVILLIFYEIIREAGLRLPKSVGGAVSLVGGIIIGDAAVSTGLISTPLLIAVALSVTASFVIPNLNQPITILRILFVIVGGIGGLYTVSLLLGIVILNICSMEDFGIPATSPISPLTLKSMSDVITRAGFKKLQNRNIDIQKLNGSHSGVEK